MIIYLVTTVSKFSASQLRKKTTADQDQLVQQNSGEKVSPGLPSNQILVQYCKNIQMHSALTSTQSSLITPFIIGHSESSAISLILNFQELPHFVPW